MGGKSPKTSTQHRRNADNTIKKTFAYFNKALSFYSHFVHIFTVYYKRSRKDAPFYFRLQSPSPKGCRHPFPFWKKKQTTTYILVYHSNIPSPLQEKQPERTAFSVIYISRKQVFDLLKQKNKLMRSIGKPRNAQFSSVEMNSTCGFHSGNKFPKPFHFQ